MVAMLAACDKGDDDKPGIAGKWTDNGRTSTFTWTVDAPLVGELVYLYRFNFDEQDICTASALTFTVAGVPSITTDELDFVGETKKNVKVAMYALAAAGIMMPRGGRQ